MYKQECIPVGRVPSAAVVVGGCLPGGDSAPGMSAQLVSTQGGIRLGCLLGGVCRGCLPQCMLEYTPPNRITDACENITLPQLCCGR